MDPISVLGIASAIITFIDFSWSLVSGTIEVQRNGRINDDQDIDTIVSDLEHITNDLRKRGPEMTRAEKSMANLSDQCLGTSQELQKLLRPLKDKPQIKRTIWKSFKTHLTTMMGKEKIDELTSKLQGHRSQLMLHLGFLLREDQSSLNVQMRAVQDSFSNLNLDLSTRLTSLRDDLIEAVKMGTTPQAPPDRGGVETTTLSEPLEMIKKMIVHLESSIVNMPIQQRVLRQLAYEEMTSRHLKIRDPEAGTLRWMLGQADPLDQDSDSLSYQFQEVRSDASQKYLAWLQKGTGVFHLAGNTGAGKSALMKYLARHESTERDLKLWAGSKTLVLADFYFWAPGNELQRSLAGMRRTLLFGALSQHPELMEKVFPRQWQRWKTSSSMTDPMVQGLQEFGEGQIEEAFAMLIENTDLSGYMLCFFIDGLDELNGDSQDHEDLAQKICSWAKAGNVKFCVSSRPYPEFKDVFRSSGHTTIYLHQLNEPDIYAYCREKLDQDRKGLLLSEQERQVLSREITWKSRGVFLWAFLVVRQVLNALRNDDPLYVLKKRLDEVPQQLDDLYTKSLESVSKSKIDRTRAYRMLLLALENPLDDSLDALAFSWIPEFDDLESQGLQDADFLDGIKLDLYSDAEIRRRLKRVTAQIQGLTRDFLEVSFDIETMSAAEFTDIRSRDRLPTVGFFHRSAHDYLLENEMQRKSLEHSWPNFAAENIYFKMLLAEMNLVPHTATGLHRNDRLAECLTNYYERKDGVAILHRLQTLGTGPGAYRPIWAHFPSFHAGLRRKTPVSDLSSGSLVHYAVYCGLERFVLEEVDLNPGLLRDRNDSNLLVCAATQHYDYSSGLVGELLDRHADLDGTHLVWEGSTGLVERWPVWVIVSIAHIQRLIGHLGRESGAPYFVRDLVRDLVRINQYAIGQGWSFAIIFSVWANENWGNYSLPHESRQIDFCEVVRFFQTLEPERYWIAEDIRWTEFLLGSTDCSEYDYQIYDVTWESRTTKLGLLPG